MKFLNNLSVRNRLFLSVVVWVLVFLTFGSYAVVKVNSLVKLSTNIYTHPLQVSNAATDARMYTLQINRDVKDLILSKDKNQIASGYQSVEALERSLMRELDTIKNKVISSTIADLESQCRRIISDWSISREELLMHLIAGDVDKATEISIGTNTGYINQLEEKLRTISELARHSAYSSVEAASESAKAQMRIFTILVAVISLLVLLLFNITASSIIHPIRALQNAMGRFSRQGDMVELTLHGDNEITEMSQHYNSMVRKLSEIIWVKDNKNNLSAELSGNISLEEMMQKSIIFLSRTLGGGNGVLYLYSKESELLEPKAFYAYNSQNQLSRCFSIGEGLVGQSALEKKIVTMTDISSTDEIIAVGLPLSSRVSVYSMPLLYEDELVGAIEISSFEAFDMLKLSFLSEAVQSIATNLYTAIQNERIKKLFKLSEAARLRSEESEEKLKAANKAMEQQQSILRLQTEELSKSNTQLEEQQLLLRQQSSELQHINIKLEESQQQMEEQSTLLNYKNRELEKSSEELLKRTMDLETANRYKSQFLANISHELRTPLNSIILLSKLLSKNDEQNLEEKALEMIHVIHNSGKDLLRLINDILDYSKIESGKIDIVKSRFETSLLADEIHQLFDNAAKEKGIELLIRDELNKVIEGDMGKISQILRNFISNALKFTPEGAIEVSFAQDPNKSNSVLLSVRDSGIGIPKEKINVIFEEFQQGDNSISKKYGGTGLGLSISKKLAQLMDGQITVKSEVGKGSEFSLCLHSALVSVEHSISKETKAAVLEEVAAVYQEAAVAVCQEVAVLEDCEKHILFVDSDGSLTEYIQEICKSVGFNIVTVKNGTEGLKAAAAKKVKGIIISNELSDMSGLDMVVKMKSSTELAAIPTQIVYPKEKDMNYQRLLDEIAVFIYRVKGEIRETLYVKQKTDEKYSLDLHNKKILIVDDDAINIFVLASALENYGADIVEAENGKVALEKLDREEVDLVLMDIMMPVMDGLEAIKTIRKDPRFKHLPIIALTAKSLKEDRDKCIDAGANDYVSKPIDYDIFIRLLKAWISK